MHNKKSDEPDKSVEEQALEQRVDAMLSTKPVPQASSTLSTPKPKPKPDPPAAIKPTAQPIREQKTAPKLPDELMATEAKDTDTPKTYKLKTPSEPPIVIALADADTNTDTNTDVGAKTEDAAKDITKKAASLNKAAEETTPADNELPDDPLKDGATDKAVDEIVANEGDTLLALADAKAARKQAANNKPSGWKQKFAALFKSKRTWIVVGLLLLVLLAAPTTRYKLAGLIIKKPVTIVVLDSKTASPVSGAEVKLDGKPVKTDAYGKARLKAAIGPHSLTVTKQYYKTTATSYFVGFKAAPAPTNIRLIATGRLVPVIVLNKITGKPMVGAEIRVLGTTAKTNAKGQAVVALPTKSDTSEAQIRLSGYNDTKVTIQITSSFVKANSFEITPSGHIYFLSNLSGKLDVVKTNLDGSGRKVVLEGTGREDSTSTSLLASRDWRFLVLKARRDGALPALYLIDTNTDKVTQFDNSDSEFDLIGWYGHSFIYDLSRKSLSYHQPGRQILKSYDADNLQLNQLDQNQAEGDSANYAYQNFHNFYILGGGAVVYNTQWYSLGSTDLSTKTDTIRAIQPSGQNKKDYQAFISNVNDYIEAKLYEPQTIYYSTHNNSDNKTTYYAYENQAVKTISIDENSFTRDYPTYLISPSGNHTFWNEPRDGKNTLFIGDASAKSKKQIASLSEYAPYGWHSDNYVLVSKASSELYIMPAGSLSAGRKPLKVTDYYKPVQTYNGYGYGYGGL
ncbi:MAG: hypothetical protein AAB971_02655 [Patescibacteria group bacterium]